MRISRGAWLNLNRPVHLPRLNLLQRFTLLGLGVTLLLGGVFGYLLSQRMAQDALQDSARETATLVRGWVGEVSAQDFLPGQETFRTWQQRLGVKERLDGVEVRVWNSQGVLIYPDDPRSAPEGGVAQALAGEAVSARASQGRLEVFVPVRVAGQVVGAYQIYRPIVPLEERISRIQAWAWGSSLGVFVLLFLALFALLRVASREIQRTAYYDPLTGLPNRHFLREIAEATLARAHRVGMGMALVILDLDRFQEINDALGAPSGDLLLKKVGERLQADLRAGDMVCRLGGDEFALLVSDVNVGGVAEVAKRILLSFGEPFELPGHRQKVYVQASLGVALYPEDGADLEELMHAADVALRRAKQEDSGFAFYRPDYDHHTQDRLALQAALHQALKEDDLTLHYQSILDLQTGALDRAEALLRWYRVGELVMPGAFIPLAEESGLIQSLDRFVLRRATLEAVRLGLQISVNFSPRSLNEPQVVEWVQQALEESRLEPARLCLEITEVALRGDSRASTLQTEREQAIANLKALRALGVRIALDDFGSGYSWLSCLKHTPVDLLKMAPTFVAGIGKDPRDEEMIRSLIALGHGLGLKVLAEGVETPEQLAWLREAGCDLAQGYGVARPVPLEILRMAPSSLAG
ncbi:putative bifunctional diguanylate cyclase/phosphodiesterase [Allomeiothermus silvanus]|uniref:putative bifunctional diguanylate cyclase/phosphodiesterase n=1 Tax=Allomeiothermus silvanus TaxID=52022 RepID=UPI0023F04EC4|nr:EAL domain-containing protein [Allomeiothermus silvanus]